MIYTKAVSAYITAMVRGATTFDTDLLQRQMVRYSKSPNNQKTLARLKSDINAKLRSYGRPELSDANTGAAASAPTPTPTPATTAAKPARVRDRSKEKAKAAAAKAAKAASKPAVKAAAAPPADDPIAAPDTSTDTIVATDTGYDADIGGATGGDDVNTDGPATPADDTFGFTFERVSGPTLRDLLRSLGGDIGPGVKVTITATIET